VLLVRYTKVLRIQPIRLSQLKFLSKSKVYYFVILVDQDIYVKNALFSEIKIIRNMTSPNVVGFIDVLETNNNYYIVQ
jgi:serine/threonine protein kinase